MKLQSYVKSAVAANGQFIDNSLTSFLEAEFLQSMQKTMQPIGSREEARRMKQPFLRFPRSIILSSPPIRPLVERNLPILHDELNKLYRMIRRSVPVCSRE